MYVTSDTAWGKIHDRKEWPVLLAGKAGGRLRGNEHHNFVSMYAYVPDAVVDNPPLVVLIHYRGGTAPAVFGQAQGGGLVAAADQYGFIIIAPSSGRCWDIVSDQTRSRDGGGDSQAIRQMVTHALDIYDANPERHPSHLWRSAGSQPMSRQLGLLDVILLNEAHRRLTRAVT